MNHELNLKWIHRIAKEEGREPFFIVKRRRKYYAGIGLSSTNEEIEPTAAKTEDDALVNFISTWMSKKMKGED